MYDVDVYVHGWFYCFVSHSSRCVVDSVKFSNIDMKVSRPGLISQDGLNYSCCWLETIVMFFFQSSVFLVFEI